MSGPSLKSRKRKTLVPIFTGRGLKLVLKRAKVILAHPLGAMWHIDHAHPGSVAARPCFAYTFATITTCLSKVRLILWAWIQLGPYIIWNKDGGGGGLRDLSKLSGSLPLSTTATRRNAVQKL